MTGTNITVLDNFFYNIEKNIFSTIVLKSQKGLWKKGAARLKIGFFCFCFFKRNKTKHNRKPTETEFTALVSTASPSALTHPPPKTPPSPPTPSPPQPGSNESAEDSAEGSTRARSTERTGHRTGIYRDWVLLSLAHAQNAQTAAKRWNSALTYLTRLIEKVN